jgi:hypothetical protein
MPKKDPRVDAFIEKSAPFAKPILKHLRKLIFEAGPELSETIKWGMPYYEQNGLVCGIAAFKEHCVMNFWKAKMMKDAKQFAEGNKEAMGSLGRITSLKDLPSDKKIIAYVKEAVELNRQ